MIRPLGNFAICVGLATTLALCPTGIRAEATTPAADPGQTIVAEVNGRPIQENRLTAVIEKNNEKVATKQSPSQLNTMRQKALAQVIDTELLFQAGRQLTIPDLEERVTAEIDSLKTDHAEALKNKGDEEIADLALRQVCIREYLIKNDLLNPQVPEEEVRVFYEKNKHNFARPEERVHVRHILVQLPQDAAEEQELAARKKIEHAGKALAAGEPFDAVAKEYSEDAAAATGGDIGVQKRGFMPPEFDEVAFSIQPNKPSGIIRSPFGYHILEVLQRFPKGYIPPLEEVKDFFSKYLQETLAPQKMTEHLSMLREKSDIKIFQGVESTDTL